MNFVEGWFREKVLGWSVNKLVGLVPVETPAYGNAVPSGHYRTVAVHYMNDGELFADFRRRGVVEFHTENWTHQDRKVCYFYVNVNDGSQVMMGVGRAVVFAPEVLARYFKIDHLRAVGKSVTQGLGGDWLKYVIGIAVGALGAYMVLSLTGLVDLSRLGQAPKTVSQLVLLFV